MRSAGVRVVLRLLLLACAPWFPHGASAERHALLVGVTEYPNLPRDRQLSGSRNDIPELRDVLVRRGFSPARITLLADGIPAAAPPTRTNVMAGLGLLARNAGPGDFVFIYFAGHGSQAPTAPATPAQYRRADGRQQIFLPKDVANWEASSGNVRNAIYDHELMARVADIRARGAFVWAVFDACHSGTLVRGQQGVPGELSLEVDPGVLGIPDAAFVQAGDSTRGGDDGPMRDLTTVAPGAGGYVAFYAAQPGEVTFQGLQPEKRPGSVVRGLFSYWFIRALAGEEGASYRQLGERIRQSYREIPRLSPTPMFTGTHLDSPLFSDAAGRRTLQWPLRDEGAAGWVLQAGQLHQLAAGSVLSLLPSPTARDADSLGYLEVRHAGMLESTVVPLAYRDRAAPQKLPSAAYARPVSSTIDFNLRVALPDAKELAASGELRGGIRKLQADWPSRRKVTWVRPGERHDVRLEVADGRLWVVPAGARRVTAGHAPTISFGLASGDAPALLKSELLTVAKSLNLQRIAAAQDPASTRGVNATLEVKRSGGVVPNPGEGPIQLEVNDEVTITVSTLREFVAVDVTALYVDERRRLQALHAGQAGAPGRCEAAGEGRKTASCDLKFTFRATGATSGLERLILISVDARSGAAPYDFSYLAQPERDVERRSSDEAYALLDEAGFGIPAGESTRSSDTPAIPSGMRLDVFDFRIREPAK